MQVNVTHCTRVCATRIMMSASPTIGAGSNSELRAAVRTPSHLRGLPSRARSAEPAAHQRSADSSLDEDEAAAARPRQPASLSPRVSSHKQLRSNSAMGMLQSVHATGSLSHQHSFSRTDSASGAGDLERMEKDVINLKAEYARLRHVAADKAAELERLLQAQGKTSSDVQAVEESEIMR